MPQLISAVLLHPLSTSLVVKQELFSTNNCFNAAPTVDASAFLGTLTAKASTNTATTFLAKTAVTTITGGAVNDTITISDSLNASVGTIVGGTGDDTLNVSAKGSSFDLDAVTAVETINITFDAVDGFNFGAGGGSDATISAATVTYAGGKADQLYGVLYWCPDRYWYSCHRCF